MEGKKLTKVKRWIKEHRKELINDLVTVGAVMITGAVMYQIGKNVEDGKIERGIQKAIDADYMILTRPNDYGNHVDQKTWCSEVREKLKG